MRFEQTAPRQGVWEPQNYDKKQGQIVLTEKESGEKLAVPNIWYNQPVSARIEAMLWYAERAEECARRCDEDKWDRWASEKAESNRADAKRLRGLAEEMRRTGKVLA